MILDVHGLTILNPVELESELNQIPGVVTNGLFARRPADLLLSGYARRGEDADCRLRQRLRLQRNCQDRAG